MTGSSIGVWLMGHMKHSGMGVSLTLSSSSNGSLSMLKQRAAPSPQRWP
eukprot:CAMPEP_0115250688 /NCGR_PEP_ID=MMETSP0270-20121206/43240_1 /TAXON_ID=71861 /ORGANISM="Scrippsiella trochoidea, Strain CCMP3099" /LENGTH=48 /DNA_ID= /DNA_START= /DNA_END= /DNA_ORIENTATION=